MAVRRCTAALLVICVVATCGFVRASTAAEEGGDLRGQLSVLRKQVTTLLERRTEDLQSIEEHMRRKLTKNQELVDVREEVRNLRLDIDQLMKATGRRAHHSPHTNQDVNDHKTLKWLSNGMAEVRTELAEVQTTLNSTAILQSREEVDGELALLRADVSSLNRELEIARSTNAKFEAEMAEMREELGSLKDHSRATAEACGKTKNQLKSVQLEWNYNWKTLVDRKPVEDPIADQRPSRHQRFLKKHVADIEKATRHLRNMNDDLRIKVAKLEEQVQSIQKSSDDNLISDGEVYDRISGNDLENYLRDHRINEMRPSPEPGINGISTEERVMNVEEQQRINTDAVLNLTKQFSSFDKLHLSMLELLENVESIDNRMDKALPEFRKEISKLEIQTSEGLSKLAALKEDQSNTRISMKAISVSVSNLQDKTEAERVGQEAMKTEIENLQKSTSVQTSKLHDHILKSESSTADVNATKSTIHLVQELKSFEKEYKSIVNKLPHDCNSVSGPNGIYLISPGDGEPILAYCSQGWTTIQKRYDGSINFNRNWNDYSNGFGTATGEHWLGNRNLHLLTESNCTKLEVNMKDIYGKYWQAIYEDFRVGDFDNGFRLVVDKYHGNASDALDYQNKMEFSTVDNDRDISNTHCASNYEGGWWFSHCQHANLNGRYNLGLTWFDSSRNEWIAVSTSEMRVKKRDVC